MAITVGMGDYVYEYQPEWPRLPVGQGFQGISGVAVDSRDRVYVFQRQGPPVLVFDADGNPLAAWERRDGVPADAHHVHVGPDDSVYLVDRDAHQILKYAATGALLSHHRYARPGRGCRRRSTIRRTSASRRRASCTSPTATATPACIAFAPDGAYLASFGSPGRGPGEFIVPPRHPRVR